MIKKISLFLSAIAIGILSIFGSISTKNAAEPQYFLENTQVKKAAVIDNSNTINFYLENDLNNYEPTEQYLLQLNENSKIYYINTNKENIEILIEPNNSSQLIFKTSKIYANFSQNTFEITYSNTQIGIFKTNIDNNENYNKWYVSDGENQNLILGLTIENFELLNDINTINDDLIPYIGNITTLEEPPIPPLEQINTLVSDIVNWFTSIFNGLGNVFYDPTANKLTAWGTIMFIGVAIMLISMALKWVISLIQGV